MAREHMDSRAASKAEDKVVTAGKASKDQLPPQFRKKKGKAAAKGKKPLPPFMAK